MRLGLGGVCRSVGERRVVVGLQKYGVGVGVGGVCKSAVARV